jgi:hypothetical protein
MAHAIDVELSNDRGTFIVRLDAGWLGSVSEDRRRLVRVGYGGPRFGRHDRQVFVADVDSRLIV